MTADEQVGVLADLYSKRALAYDTLWSPVIRPLGESLINRLRLSDSKRVIDVGTGAGALLPAIQSAAPDATVLGIDRSEGMLRLAKTRYAGPLEVMDAQRLASPDGVFDAAVVAFVLFHLPQPVRCLEEVHRVLRPKGSVGTITWANNDCPNANPSGAEGLETAETTAPMLPATANRGCCNTPKKLAALLQQAGFGQVHSWIEPVDHRWRPEDSFDYHVHATAFTRLQSLSSEKREDCLRRVTDRLSALGGDGYWFHGTVVMATAVKLKGRDSDG